MRLLTADEGSKSVCVRTMEKTACDLELSAFICVHATVRDLFPSDIRLSISWAGARGNGRGVSGGLYLCVQC